jgi:hypothetical protein
MLSSATRKRPFGLTLRCPEGSFGDAVKAPIRAGRNSGRIRVVLILTARAQVAQDGGVERPARMAADLTPAPARGESVKGRDGIEDPANDIGRYSG